MVILHKSERDGLFRTSITTFCGYDRKIPIMIITATMIIMMVILMMMMTFNDRITYTNIKGFG